MFKLFNKKKSLSTKPENFYFYEVKEDITAYKLFKITHPRRFYSYEERDEWYNKLPENAKRHIVKSPY